MVIGLVIKLLILIEPFVKLVLDLLVPVTDRMRSLHLLWYMMLVFEYIVCTQYRFMQEKYKKRRYLLPYPSSALLWSQFGLSSTSAVSDIATVCNIDCLGIGDDYELCSWVIDLPPMLFAKKWEEKIRYPLWQAQEHLLTYGVGTYRHCVACHQ